MAVAPGGCGLWGLALPGQNVLIRRCFQEAILLSSAMIRHTARSAAAGMRAAAASAVTPHQAQEWSAAAQSLEAQRRKLSAEYCRLLERHLGHAIDELEAVDDLRRMNRDALGALARRQSSGDADTEPVSLRLQQRVLPLAEQRLTTLDSHLSAALGLQTVRPEINPFRPEILCNALADLTVHHMARPEELELWLTYLAPPYAGGLKRLYIDLVQLMQGQGVADARFQLEVAALPAGPGEAAAPPQPAVALPLAVFPHTGHQAALPLLHPRARIASDLQQQAEHAAADGQGRMAAQPEGRARMAFPTMQQLAHVLPAVSRAAVHAFLHEPHWARDLDAPLPPAYFTALAQSAERFEAAAREAQAPDAEALLGFHAQRRALSPVDRPAFEFDLQHWLAGEEWGAWRSPVRRAQQVLLLKQEAMRIGEVMAIDSTGMMLAQLAADTSLLWPVREAFLALSPALMQLAVQRPWYLADAGHPARRFIEAVAQKSYEFNDEYAAIFQAFMAPLAACVQVLQALENADARALEHAFERAHEQLAAAWREADQAGDDGQQASLKALQFAQDRQALANEIAAELAGLDAVGQAPEPVVKLMLETWPLVLAHARLKDARRQRDPGGFHVAGMDLVWSLSGQAAVNDPVRAFVRLPSALAKLREGMEMIGASPADIEATLGMLLPYHRRLLEMRRRRLQHEGRLPAHEGGDGLPDSLPQGLVDQPVDAQRLLPADDRTPWMSAAGQRLPEPGAETRLGALGLDGLTTDSASGELDPQQIQAEAERALQRMGHKDWFDMFSHGEWQRVQLVWCNDNRSLFMFQGRTGSPHSMTRRICLKLLQQDLLRPVKVRSRSRSRKLVSVLDSGHAPDSSHH
jgi:hypothetical protein